MAVMLSIISFQFSSYTSEEILKVATEDVRSNARIQAHDLEGILAKSRDSINTNLQVIASEPSVLSKYDLEKARSVFNAAQNSTSDLTDFYMWLDKDGSFSGLAI